MLSVEPGIFIPEPTEMKRNDLVFKRFINFNYWAPIRALEELEEKMVPDGGTWSYPIK